MLIDTFPFNRDFRALEIRLSEIGEISDLIIVSESPLTHSGHPKPLMLTQNQDVLGRYRNKVKIVYPELTKLKTSNPRIREMFQRQAISKFLQSLKLSKYDFIFHSDCDEIPRAEILQKIVKDGLLGNYLLEFRNFANALNLQDGHWRRGRLVSYNFYVDIQQLRKDIFLDMVFRNRRLPIALIRTPDFWTRRTKFISLPNLEMRPEMQLILDAGWHFNNLLSVDEVLQKIADSCHTEWNTDETRKLAKKRFLEGKDIYNGKTFDRVEIDSSFPEHIRKNIDNWTEFLR